MEPYTTAMKEKRMTRCGQPIIVLSHQVQRTRSHTRLVLSTLTKQFMQRVVFGIGFAASDY